MLTLSKNQEAFCQLVVSGRPAGRAYEEAGYTARGSTADSAGSRLLSSVKVSERIAELRSEIRDQCKMSRQDALDFLVDVIKTAAGTVQPEDALCQEFREASEHHGATIKMPAKMDAFDKLAKMNGWYQPEQVNLGVSDPMAEFLKSIRSKR